MQVSMGFVGLRNEMRHLVDGCDMALGGSVPKGGNIRAGATGSVTDARIGRQPRLRCRPGDILRQPGPFAGQPAVQLEKEEMVVLGQVVRGVTVDDLKVGMTMELVLEALHETEDDIKVTWKWQPVTG